MVVTPNERPAEPKRIEGGPDLASVDRSRWPVRPLSTELSTKAGPVPIVFAQSALEAIGREVIRRGRSHRAGWGVAAPGALPRATPTTGGATCHWVARRRSARSG